MAELPNASQIVELASLLAPGLLILGIRARFKDGAVPELKEQLIGYGVASIAYFAAVSPLFHVTHGIGLSPWLWQLSQFFVAPCLVAAGVVWFDQSEWFYRVCARLRLRLSHHIPAAWDYAFSRIDSGSYVLVRLSDGTLYAGKMGQNSFASSSTGERDLYLEEVWNSDASPWKPVEPRRGVLLCGRDIKWVEIFAR